MKSSRDARLALKFAKEAIVYIPKNPITACLPGFAYALSNGNQRELVCIL
jgi:hypothetical protein